MIIEPIFKGKGNDILNFCLCLAPLEWAFALLWLFVFLLIGLVNSSSLYIFWVVSLCTVGLLRQDCSLRLVHSCLNSFVLIVPLFQEYIVSENTLSFLK